MKKILSLLLVTLMILCLCSCSTNEVIEIKGAFRNGNIITIVFDYSDYETPLPENVEGITLTINETTYNIANNFSSTSHNTGVTTKTYDCYERYYGYSYALDYGTVSQSTPKRMMAVFQNVEETDLSNVIFSIGEHTVDLIADDFTEIGTQSEIIKAEDNFEEAYQIAAFKWRIDSAYSRAEELDIYDQVPFGSALNYLSEQIALTFDSDVNWGVEIFASPGVNYSYKGKLKDGIVNEYLPSFDVDIVKNAFPDAVSQIDTIIDNTNTLSKYIIDPSKSLKDFDVKGTRGAIKGTYSELCKIFDMDMIIATHS